MNINTVVCALFCDSAIFYSFTVILMLLFTDPSMLIIVIIEIFINSIITTIITIIITAIIVIIIII